MDSPGEPARQRVRATAPRVAIIGAGLGGVACAVNLKRAGIDDFCVFEQAAGPGGVWWHNTYPGCEVDVNSQAYSFRFMPYIWQRSHATQLQMQQYVEDVIDHFRIRPQFRFGVQVRAVIWSDDTNTYTLHCGGEVFGGFDAVVSAVGMLSVPFWPDWAQDPSRFSGKVMHTAQFDNETDFTGKTVAVVGTGSSACQVAPQIAAVARHLDLFQREPGYVLPKRTHDFSAAEVARYRRFPFLRKLDRWKLMFRASQDTKAFKVDSKQQQAIRAFHASYLARKVPDVHVRALLTPDYPYGCKRPVFASGYYEMFSQPNVTVVPHAVGELTESGVVDSQGTGYSADILVLATGFQATRYLTGLTVTGSGGRDLHTVWQGDPTAFLGMTVPGFPNFFIMYGPNTNGGWSVCAQLERQSEVVVKLVRRLRAHRGSRLEVRESFLRTYDRWIQRGISHKRTAFESKCHNYYHSASGKNVTQWPFSHATYVLATKLLPRRAIARS
jgi:cation diffusion facilitator CzcD-associated flavoprotein CzcO